MKESDVTKQAIWAVDPWDTETCPDARAIAELKTWADTTGSAVRPVYILHAPSLEFIDEDALPLSDEVEAAQRATTSFLRKLGADWAEAPVILPERTASTVYGVDRLIAYAEECGAELITLSSHGRSGAQRLFLGSFAELVLLRSHLPVLFLSHDQLPAETSPKKALFATDFSPYSKAAYERFLGYAKRSGIEVVLFHQAPLPPEAEALMVSAGGYLPENYLDEQIAWAEGEAARWVELAEAQGISARALISDQRGFPSEQILGAARSERVGLIAMASQSGPFTSFLLGSVARGVFRPHEFPVWVCGPKFLKEKSTDVEVTPAPYSRRPVAENSA